jgi:hypothetical protein
MMLTTYSFQAVITNTELKPLPLLRTYNQRANIENRIDEIKEGYTLEQNSMHSMMTNLFTQAFLPESLQKCEVKTIRRVVLKVPGNIVGNGRYQHIRLAASRALEIIVKVILQKAKEFAERMTPKIPMTEAA